MRYFWLPLCIALLAATCLPAYCTIPAFRGYTGLIVVPTADALGKGDWNGGVFWEDVSDGAITDIVGNYGLAQGLELGVDRFRANEDADSHTLVNVKYKFMPETIRQPAIAVGVADLVDDIQTTVYAVASKSLGCDLRVWEGETLSPRLHVGFGGGRLSGIFLGASAYIGNRVELMAEWDSDAINVGARWRVTKVFTIHAAGINLNDQQDPFSDSASFGVGGSFNIIY